MVWRWILELQSRCGLSLCEVFCAQKYNKKKKSIAPLANKEHGILSASFLLLNGLKSTKCYFGCLKYVFYYYYFCLMLNYHGTVISLRFELWLCQEFYLCSHYAGWGGPSQPRPPGKSLNVKFYEKARLFFRAWKKPKTNNKRHDGEQQSGMHVFPVCPLPSSIPGYEVCRITQRRVEVQAASYFANRCRAVSLWVSC